MQIALRGVEKGNRESVCKTVVAELLTYGINVDTVTWDCWEDADLVDKELKIQLPGTPEIREAINRGLLVTMSRHLPEITISVPNANRSII